MTIVRLLQRPSDNIIEAWRADTSKGLNVSSDFWIQSSCPRWVATASPDDGNVSEAIQTVFPMTTEVALLVWRHIYVPLGYKYCVSFLVDDVVEMIHRLSANQMGSWRVEWPSNEFAGTWSFEWDAGQLRVQSEWRAVVGGTEQLLQARSELQMGLRPFLCEWTKLLMTVADALTGAGYTDEMLPDFGRLKDAIVRAGGVGAIYL